MLVEAFTLEEIKHYFGAKIYAELWKGKHLRFQEYINHDLCEDLQSRMNTYSDYEHMPYDRIREISRFLDFGPNNQCIRLDKKGNKIVNISSLGYRLATDIITFIFFDLAFL